MWPLFDIATLIALCFPMDKLSSTSTDLITLPLAILSSTKQ